MQRTPIDSSTRTEHTSSDAYNTRDALNRAERNAASAETASASRQANRASSLRTGSNNASRQAARPSSRTGTASAARRTSSSSAGRSTAQRRATAYDGYLDEQRRSSRPSSGTGQRRGSSGQQRRPASSGNRTGTAGQTRPHATASKRPSSARTAASRSRSSGGRTKKNKTGFKKVLIVYSAILLVILIIGLLVFNSFIANYEKNQPVNIAKSVTEALNTDPVAYLSDHKDMISSMSNTDEVISKYAASVEGRDLSYVENSESRAEAPSFDIRADGATVGKLTLEPDGKGSFGLSKWKLASLDVAAYIPNTYAYTILAPNGYTVAINGNDLSDDYISAKDETPEILTNAAQFIKEVPKYDSYTVSGLLSIPDVTAKDASGSDVGVAAAQEYFVAGGEPGKEFVADRKEFVEDALTSWAYHFINYNNGQSPLSNFVQSGSDLYSYIFGSDTMDPIYTGFYDWEYITNVEFTEFEAKNYIQYADDCFSVDVKYRLKVDFSNNNLSDDAQMLDATWVIVKNGNYWGICDVIYHQGGDSSLANEVASQNGAKETTEAADSEETTIDEETTEK